MITTREQASSFLLSVFNNQISQTELSDTLHHIESKPYTVPVALGFHDALRNSARVPSLSFPTPLLDICGTGGSGKERFNISTCSAFVLAAAGVAVAKHGNYGSKKPNGSFNFLEALGIPFHFSAQTQRHLLKETRLCFLLARSYYPAMAALAPFRKQIGTPTLFNLLGPLSNPFNPTHQVIGLSNDTHLDLLIQLTRALNKEHILFCIGGDGLDEVSIKGTTRFIHCHQQSITHTSFNFEDSLGYVSEPYSCGTSADNAMIFLDIMLENNHTHPIVKHICINTAAALWCVNHVATLEEGYHRATSLFCSNQVESWIAFYKECAATCPTEDPTKK